MVLSLREKLFFTKKIEGQKNPNFQTKSYQEWFELFQASRKNYFMKRFSLQKLLYAQKPWFFIGFCMSGTKIVKKVCKIEKIQI